MQDSRYSAWKKVFIVVNVLSRAYMTVFPRHGQTLNKQTNKQTNFIDRLEKSQWVGGTPLDYMQV